MSKPGYVLVTGSTGFIGTWVVEELINRGYKVRAATRTLKKRDETLAAHPEWKDQLDFVEVADFEGETDLSDAVKDIDGIIHVASPFRYDVTDNEKELVLPAINGVKALFAAAAKNPKIKRIVLTSSFASVVDISRTATPDNKDFVYTAEHWNPLSYAEAIDPAGTPVVAYRGSKKFAELEAWRFVKEEKPSFSLVTICPPMVFGPVANPITDPKNLGESNQQLWGVATAPETLPETRVPLWIDVRDLAKIHVEALFNEQAGGKRITAASPEKYSYGFAAKIIREKFPHRARKSTEGETMPTECYSLDGYTAAKMFGVEYHPFETTVVDLVNQVEGWTKA